MTTTGSTSLITSQQILIGARSDSSSYFNGSISQVCIFDYALSEPQVSSLYNSGSPINPMTLKPAPMVYYPLGGNASTGGDPLTIENPTTISVPNVAVPDASVFDFDGNSLNFGDKLGNLIGDNYTGGLSFSFWMNPDITSSEDGVFNFESNRISFVIRSNSLRLYSPSCSAGQCFSYNYTNPNNEWAHCVISFLPSGSSFYLNGQPVRTWTYTDLNVNGKDFSIGWYATTNYAYGGQLSNFQIWNTALSESDAQTLYNNGQPLLTDTQPQAANLKAWYKLDQSANWEADTTGNWQIPDNRSAYPQSFNFNG